MKCFHNGILWYKHNALSLQARSKIWCHLGNFVNLCGSSWPFMALYGSLWLFVTLYGSLWSFVVLCGSIWLYMALCDSLWPFMALCGPLCLFMALCGFLWLFVALCGSLWLFVALNTKIRGNLKCILSHGDADLLKQKNSFLLWITQLIIFPRHLETMEDKTCRIFRNEDTLKNHRSRKIEILQ